MKYKVMAKKELRTQKSWTQEGEKRDYENVPFAVISSYKYGDRKKTN
jgi:hypothetical protein